MTNKPLTLEEIERFNQMLKYDLDTVVRCQKCGRTQFLRLEWGIKDGWDECCENGVMPIIYHKISEKTKEDVIRLVKDIAHKMEYAPNGSQVF